MASLDILLAKNQAWNTRSIAVSLFGAETSSNMKKTERWLVEKELNFCILNEENIADEHERKPKVLVTKQIVRNSKKWHSDLCPRWR